MTEATANRTCQLCNGEITPEQIAQKTAGLVAGVLMCPNCVEAKRKELIAAQQRASQPAPSALHDITDEKISLIDEREMPKGPEASKIRSFAGASTLGGAHHDAELKRSLAASGEPASRCRTFHSKLTPAALSHMDDLINEFLDTQPDVYVKFATTAVGMFEAKLHPEPHLVLTIFY